MLPQAKAHSAGFTLVELLVVTAIVAMLAGTSLRLAPASTTGCMHKRWS